jgi:hypothetical protein
MVAFRVAGIPQENSEVHGIFKNAEECFSPVLLVDVAFGE